MRNLIIAFALMFSAFTFGQMSFNVSDLDLANPMNSQANLGWFMTDDIMVSFGMDDWDTFNASARYYTGFAGNMFVQAGTNATPSKYASDHALAGTVIPEGAEGAGSTYVASAAIGWTKALGIWKLQFEPMIVLEDIQDFTPMLQWGLRFNL
jgi:hypothetical protein